jgi:ubiquinone/menaquinone biosynthesis C-methylase UbiE
VTDTAEDLAAQMKLRSRSFDAWALDYDRYRPTYPQALFDHIAARLGLREGARVADVGAGTGKAARQMARRGWRVTAIEPGKGMLEVMRARAAAESLDIDVRLASAEQTGLPDASVDLVTAGQAYHWFDKERAVAEMARIVRPKGGVALFWNAPAEARSPFLSTHTDVMARYLPEAHVDRRSEDADNEPPDVIGESDKFECDDWVVFSHDRELSAEDFIALVFTASQVRLFVDDDHKDQLRADIRANIARYFGDGRVLLPYDTSLFLAIRNEVAP